MNQSQRGSASGVAVFFVRFLLQFALVPELPDVPVRLVLEFVCWGGFGPGPGAGQDRDLGINSFLAFAPALARSEFTELAKERSRTASSEEGPSVGLAVSLYPCVLA